MRYRVLVYFKDSNNKVQCSLLRRIKKNGHTKVITIVDNMIPHESRIGDTVFTKYFIGPVDGFVAMSDSVLHDIQKFDTKKPKILTPHPLFDNQN